MMAAGEKILSRLQGSFGGAGVVVIHADSAQEPPRLRHPSVGGEWMRNGREMDAGANSPPWRGRGGRNSR